MKKSAVKITIVCAITSLLLLSFLSLLFAQSFSHIKTPSDTSYNDFSSQPSVSTPPDEISKPIPVVPTPPAESGSGENSSVEAKDEVIIRNLIGSDKEEAKLILEQAELKYEINFIYSPEKLNTVCSMDYSGRNEGDFYYIEKNSLVTLYVSKGKNLPSSPEKIIYLTFDDGPSKKYTEEFLAVLDKYNIKASFLIVGEFAKTYPELVKKMYDAGHCIGSHSYSHDHLSIYQSVESFEADMKKWEKTIYDIIGEELPYKVMRFPCGSNTSYIPSRIYNDILSSVESLGYKAFDWTLANNDKWFGNKKPGQTIDEYLKESVILSLEMRKNQKNTPKIMLMHETSGDSLKMLEWTIQMLLEEGYTFGTLDMLESSWLFKK